MAEDKVDVIKENLENMIGQELPQEELEPVAGGLNPQPLPPGKLGPDQG